MTQNDGEATTARLAPEPDLARPEPASADAPRAEPRYLIVRGDERLHREEVLELGERNLPDSPGATRFCKYYDRSPLGPPLLLLARERATGALVGMASLLPSMLRVEGHPVRAAISADFAIEAGHRGLGPALPLQRAALELVAEEGLACAYGCPNPLSEPIVKRVGFESVGELARYTKVLRTRLLVDLFVSRPGLARMLSAASRVLVDPLISLGSRERRVRRLRGLSFEKPARFDERFAAVWADTAKRHSVTGERNAELLNWKYDFDDAAPPSEFVILAAVDTDDQVAGYVVYRVKDGVRHVFDLAVLDSKRVIDALLAEFVSDARREGAIGLTFLCLGTLGMLGARLRAFRFLGRKEGKRLRVYLPGRARPGAALLQPENWYFVMGDDDF